MIMTIDDLLNSGLDVSEEIASEKLALAIGTAENFMVKPRLGGLYDSIVNDPDGYDNLINGGAWTVNTEYTTTTYQLTGLKYAILHLAYAFLLRQNIGATTFGSVMKKDDYSVNAAESELHNLARFHTTVGMAYLDEIMDAYGLDKTLNYPNYYEELV